jgi:hypothetical protein
MRGAVSAGESLAQLHELIAGEGGELASALVPLSGAQAEDPVVLVEAFGPLAAAGERTRRQAGEYGLLVESIFEGYLLHYWRGRLLDLPDEDLRLLGGDFLYALGLSRLAGLGDVEAVSELADLISLSARVHAVAGAAREAVSPAEGVWALCSLGVAGGGWGEGETAKAALRERPEHGADALQVAFRRAQELGISQEAEQALIAFREVVSSASGTT